MILNQIEYWIRNHKHESFHKTLQLNFVVHIFSQFTKHTRVETTSTIVKKFCSAYVLWCKIMRTVPALFAVLLIVEINFDWNVIEYFLLLSFQ